MAPFALSRVFRASHRAPQRARKPELKNA